MHTPHITGHVVCTRASPHSLSVPQEASSNCSGVQTGAVLKAALLVIEYCCGKNFFASVTREQPVLHSITATMNEAVF